MLILEKYPKLLIGLSWVLNLLAIFYFGYITWLASIDFGGFTSMLFGIPILLILLVFAYLTGVTSERVIQACRFPKFVSQLTSIMLILFYLTGFFPSLQKVTDLPIKIVTRLSEKLTGKSPQQWAQPVSLFIPKDIGLFDSV